MGGSMYRYETVCEGIAPRCFRAPQQPSLQGGALVLVPQTKIQAGVLVPPMGVLVPLKLQAYMHAV